MTRIIHILVIASLLSFVAGCESIQFYQQAISGQANLLWQRQAIEPLLASDVEPELRERLELAIDILSFAEDIGLDSHGAYSSYVATGKPYVVWNVFVADPLELSLKTSCFPVAGCVSYRGYFDEQDARRYAARLKDEGYDVYVGGVAAYSTLGWFEDPLMDTFLFRPETQLAALLFHELAHQLVYIRGDTRFNESMATAVEQYALELYLRDGNSPGEFDRYIASRERRSQVIRLISEVRGELRVLYGSEHSQAEKLKQKSEVFEDMVERFDLLAASWSEGTEYRDWIHGPMNNAKLETVADYHEWVPVMLQEIHRLGFEGFVAWLRQLEDLSESERLEQLTTLSSKPG